MELTIKALGDFTRTIGRTPVGTRAYLAGPYGAFALDLRAPRPLVCIAGGIGIPPMMSMIRTLHRPCSAGQGGLTRAELALSARTTARSGISPLRPGTR